MLSIDYNNCNTPGISPNTTCDHRQRGDIRAREARIMGATSSRNAQVDMSFGGQTKVNH